MNNISLPLDPKHFYILLALSKEPMHGHAIYQQIQIDTLSALHIYPTTLYRILRAQEKQGLIEAVRQERGQGGAQASRTVYRITEGGRRILRAEGAQWQDAGRLAKRRVG